MCAGVRLAARRFECRQVRQAQGRQHPCITPVPAGGPRAGTALAAHWRGRRDPHPVAAQAHRRRHLGEARLPARQLRGRSAACLVNGQSAEAARRQRDGQGQRLKPPALDAADVRLKAILMNTHPAGEFDEGSTRLGNHVTSQRRAILRTVVNRTDLGSDCQSVRPGPCRWSCHPCPRSPCAILPIRPNRQLSEVGR